MEIPCSETVKLATGMKTASYSCEKKGPNSCTKAALSTRYLFC